MSALFGRRTKGFVRRAVIYLTVLVMFVDLPTLQQVIAEELSVRDAARARHQQERAVRTYVDESLSAARQQQIILTKQLGNCRRAFKAIEKGKAVDEVVEDMKVLDGRLEQVHLSLAAELTQMRANLVEKGLSAETIKRHDEFCKKAEERYQQLDRALSLVQNNKGKGDRLRQSLAAVIELGAGGRKSRRPRNILGRSQESMPKRLSAIVSRSPARPPFFQWPWLVAAADDVISQILVRIGQINDVRGLPVPEDLDCSAPEMDFDPNDSQDAIVKKAQELGFNPVRIFEYVRNEMVYEPYYGSVRGAKGTLAQGGGNDIDLGSLLMALLRAGGIPCRYVFGTIELTTKQAADWTGINGPQQIVNFFETAGVPVEPVYGGQNITAIRVDHVWVKAYVDNFPYRGAAEEEPNRPGDSWVDLDASFKQHTFTVDRGLEQADGIDVDPDTLLTNALYDANVVEQGAEKYAFNIDENLIVEQLLDLAEPIRSYLAARDLTSETVFRQRKVCDERYGVLPVADMYRIYSRGVNLSTLPDELRQRLMIALKNDDGTLCFSYMCALSELVGRKITLAYQVTGPDSAAAIASADTDDDPNTFPVLFTQLKPQLLVDDQVVAEAVQQDQMVPMAQWQDLEIVFIEPDGSTSQLPDGQTVTGSIERITHPIRAGGMQALVLDGGTITAEQLDRQGQILSSIGDAFDANEPLLPQESVGEILHSIGLTYFHQLDRFNQIAAGSLGLAVVRQPSLVRVAWDLDVVDLYGDESLPFRATSSRVRIAPGRDVQQVVSIDGGSSGEGAFSAENQFLFTSALTSSALEYNTLIQSFADRQGVSAAQVIRLANSAAPDNPIYTISSAADANTLTTAGGSLSALPDFVKEDIKDKVNAGCEITVCRDPVKVSGCNYIGYIARDIDTSQSEFVLYDADGVNFTSAELIDGSITPVQLLEQCAPDSCAEKYEALEQLLGPVAGWVNVAEGSTTNAGLSYLPAIMDVDHWFENRTQLDPATTVASVLAVASPVVRLASQSGIFNVVAGAGVNSGITQNDWVGVDANEFIIEADVTRGALWQANVYKYGQSSPHLAQIQGTDAKLKAVFEFGEPNDGYYRYELTAGSGQNRAVPVEGYFSVDLTRPSVSISSAAPPVAGSGGSVVVKGTVWDDYFDRYEVYVTQGGGEPVLVWKSTEQFKNQQVLCTIDTTGFDDSQNIDVTVKAYDLAGNVGQDTFYDVDISNPDTSPPDVNVSASSSGAALGPDVHVHDTIDVSVEPVDPNEVISRIELRWCNQDGTDCQLVAVEQDPNGGPLDINSVNHWTYEVDPYMFCNGPSSLVVNVCDMFGNCSREQVDFFNDTQISNFRASPSVATSFTPVVNVSASFKTSALWTLTIYDCNATAIATRSGTGVSVFEYFDTASPPWMDGTYTAHLSVDGGAHQADTAFRVALSAPVAEISNIKSRPADNALYKQMSLNPRSDIDGLQVIGEGLFELKGSAYHPSFAGTEVEYKVELFKPQIGDYPPQYWKPGYDIYAANYVTAVTPGEPNAQGWSKICVESGSLGILDFSGVENGAYQMLLTVRYNGAEAYANVPFVLDCPLKIGNVKFSQEDLVVPVAGMPIRVTRTYDSMQKDSDGKFGYGWSYSILNDMDIELNETRVLCDDGFGGEVSVRWSSNFDRNVTLTLPDGTRATFIYSLKYHPANYSGGEMNYWTAEYISPLGVSATLKTDPYPQKVNALGFWNNILGTTGAAANGDNYDFPGFVLTTEDGTKYRFEREQYEYDMYLAPSDYGGYPFWAQPYGEPKLTEIATPSGEKIHIADGQITSTDAQGTQTAAVEIIYGANGRISAVRGPSEQRSGEPNTVEYKYDAYDNLVAVSRLVDKQAVDYNDGYETTTYIYDNPENHFITDINDSRGLTPVRFIYDESGRLTETIDARGFSVKINHDVDGKAETVTDRNGYTTIYLYNERGNVIRTTNPLGETTAYEYADAQNPDKPTTITTAYPNGPSTNYTYDENGRTQTVTDPLGNTTTYAYDRYGNLTQTVQYRPDPQHQGELIEVSRTTSKYDDNTGLLLWTDDSAGHRTSYFYDTDNRLVKTVQQVEDPCDPQSFLDVITVNTYDDGGNFPSSPSSVTGPDGTTTYFEYDKSGNQTKSWYQWSDPNNPANSCKVYTITEYDAKGRVIATIRDVNDTTGDIEPYTKVLSETFYNKIGKADVVVDQFGQLTRYQYDESGNLVETTTYRSEAAYEADPNDYLTTSRTLYDKEGRAIVSTEPHDPCSAVIYGTQTVYDALGRVTQTIRWADVNIPLEEITAGGEIVGRKNIFDIYGRPVWSKGWVLSRTETQYDSFGRVWKTLVQDESGELQETQYEYDLAGKQTAVIDALGNRTEYEYEGSRRVLFRDARGNETRYQYDSLGRIKKTIFADGTFSSVGYDSLGRRTAQTDQAGRTRRFEYDTAGRLRAVILPAVKDPANGDTLTYPRYEYEYDSWGNLVTIRDNVKQYKLASQADFNPTTDIVRTYARETTFAYNEMHQQRCRTLPDGRTEYKSYDSDGRLIESVDFAGQVTAYLYEDVNAPSAVSAEKYYGDDGRYPDEPNLVIGYTYDRFGRKVTSEVNDLDADTLAVYKNYYDSQGRLYGLASPQGYIRYTFSDISNRQLDVVTPEASVEDASFYDKVEYGYDQLGRLNTVTVKQRNSQPVNETTAYSYDPAGSLATIDYPNGNTASYTYDNLNRLTRLEHRDTDRIIASYDYTLGADGMRTAAREITYNGSSYDTTNINWTYDAINRLTAEDCNAPSDVNDFEHSYVYDIVGNRLQKIADGNTVTYSYDSLTDELLSEHTPDVNTFYDYDDNGSLVAEYNDICAVRDYSYNLRGRLSSVTAGGVTVSYSYDADGFRVAADNGQTAEHYLVDPFNQTGYSQILKSDDGTNVKFYTIGNDVIAQAKDSQSPQYFAYDGHGSTRLMTDDVGQITDRYSYDAYGNARFNTSSAATNLLYCGEMYDRHTAQYYLRARWYSPNTGRFNRLDPFGGDNQDPQSLHKYLYCHANPLNTIDPTGRISLSEINVSMVIQASLMTMNFMGAIYNFRRMGIAAVKLINCWSMGDFWDGLGYLVVAIVHGIAAAMNIVGMVAGYSAPPPGAIAALSVSGLGGISAGAIWASIVANPALAEWVVTQVAPLAMTCYLVFMAKMVGSGGYSSGGGSQNHHKVPLDSRSHKYSDHPLVKQAGWTEEDLTKDPVNVLRLGNHAGRHSSVYHQKILQMLNNAANSVAGKGQAAADKALREVLKNIDKRIADGTLRPYENKDLWIMPGD
jgi:RHS repeat-associated protein